MLVKFQDIIRSVQRLPRTAWVTGALPVVWLAFGPVLITSVQMLVGGGLQLAVGLLTGEAAQVVPHQLVLAIPAFVYLVAVPSLIGFPLFSWLLSEVPVHVADTAAYVAPAVPGAGLAAAGRAGHAAHVGWGGGHPGRCLADRP